MRDRRLPAVHLHEAANLHEEHEGAEHGDAEPEEPISPLGSVYPEQSIYGCDSDEMLRLSVEGAHPLRFGHTPEVPGRHADDQLRCLGGEFLCLTRQGEPALAGISALRAEALGVA